MWEAHPPIKLFGDMVPFCIKIVVKFFTLSLHCTRKTVIFNKDGLRH